MVYVRGHAHDFDEWEKMGATGWSYKNCLPYFQRAETFEGGPDAYRGGDGPLFTSLPEKKGANPLFRAFVDAGSQAGYGETLDPNGHLQEGFSHMQRTIHKGARWSASDAYLKPVLSRPNLTVITKAMVKSILFEGKKAVGVRYEKSGQSHDVHVNLEVRIGNGKQH